MVKLKKYRVRLKHFVLFLTFASVAACGTQKQQVARIEGREIQISGQVGQSEKVDAFIEPYRQKVDRDLNTVLAYAPQTLDKNGQWQTTMGNMFSDVARQYGSRLFLKREGKPIDIVMLNNGGIRTIIPKGDVTTRTAFEIMPFENSMVVCAMRGTVVNELVRYIITERKPHPLSGLTFTIGKSGAARNILVNGQPLQEDQLYYVGTNDYLYSGGDNMTFFKKSEARYDLDYKLRNILIDYFTDVDTVPLITDERISVEK